MQRLVITAPAVGQRVMVSVLALLLPVPLVCLGMIVTKPLRHLVGTPGLVAYAVFTVVAVVLTGYGLVKAYRSVVWLEGTKLAVRGAFTTRRCDLATAPVRIGNAGGSGSWRIPCLYAQQPGSGRWLKVPLRTWRGDLIDPSRIRALAAAVAATQRPAPERDHAVWVATGLRQLADNPVYHML